MRPTFRENVGYVGGNVKNNYIIEAETIKQRLEEMARQSDPSNTCWFENCSGSRKALVIFVGPSPGGIKESKRREIKRNFTPPLWDTPYSDPVKKWSKGFGVSFKPIVEEILGLQYDDASKLIAITNMDWLRNPESQDVSYRYMWEGCLYILL